MKEVPNRIVFSEMEEIHVSACNANISNIVTTVQDTAGYSAQTPTPVLSNV